LTQKKIKLEIIFKKFIPLLSCIQKYLDGMWDKSNKWRANYLSGTFSSHNFRQVESSDQSLV
jgi:hypothetical protein